MKIVVTGAFDFRPTPASMLAFVPGPDVLTVTEAAGKALIEAGKGREPTPDELNPPTETPTRGRKATATEVNDGRA